MLERFRAVGDCEVEEGMRRMGRTLARRRSWLSRCRSWLWRVRQRWEGGKCSVLFPKMLALPG
jgi:hypothetical protein